jgi:type-F conjugative transfer system pilin assembly protein TrbC
MPTASLKKLAYQALQHNALLVIRGMVKGSMQETAKLVDEIDHPLDIDPKLFERFGIIQVPVFMVYHNQGWHKVSGNVELNFALESVNKDQFGHTQQKENSYK